MQQGLEHFIDIGSWAGGYIKKVQQLHLAVCMEQPNSSSICGCKRAFRVEFFEWVQKLDH